MNGTGTMLELAYGQDGGHTLRLEAMPDPSRPGHAALAVSWDGGDPLYLYSRDIDRIRLMLDGQDGPDVRAHDLAMAAMPTGSAVEAWEDGWKAGRTHGLDEAIRIVTEYGKEHTDE